MKKRLSKNSVLQCPVCQKLYSYYQIKYNKITESKGICINCYVKYGNENYLRIDKYK